MRPNKYSKDLDIEGKYIARWTPGSFTRLLNCSFTKNKQENKNVDLDGAILVRNTNLFNPTSFHAFHYG